MLLRLPRALLRGEKLHFSPAGRFRHRPIALKYRCTPFGSRICVDVYIQRFQSRVVFYGSREHDQKTLACDGGYAVECRADADVERLFVFGQSQHVEAVGSYVVGGGGEADNPEDCKG